MSNKHHKKSMDEAMFSMFGVSKAQPAEEQLPEPEDPKLIKKEQPVPVSIPAVTKPTTNGSRPTPDWAKKSPPTISNSDSPMMGSSTIRNENSATTALLLPRISPVAMVVPERLSPGIVATACAVPITAASPHEITSLFLGLALCAKVSSAAVRSSIAPTMSIM